MEGVPMPIGSPRDQEKIRAVLQKLQDGYRRRDVESLDQLANLFVSEPFLEVIGTGAIFPGEGEWCFGWESTRQLIKWDWQYWGDVRLDIDNARIHVIGRVAWLSTVGAVSDKVEREFAPQDEQRTAPEGAGMEGKVLEIIGEGTSTLYEVREEAGLWPFRFTAVLARYRGVWRFQQVQFSFPTTRMPDVRLDKT
jgi:hypothetical protein